MNLINKLKEIYVNRLLYKKTPSKAEKNLLVVMADIDMALIVASVLFLFFGVYPIGSIVFLVSLIIFVAYLCLNLRVYEVRPATDRIPDWLQELYNRHIIVSTDTELLKKIVKQGRKKRQPKSFLQSINDNALLTTIVGGVIVMVIGGIGQFVRDAVNDECGFAPVAKALNIIFLAVIVAVACMMIYFLIISYTNNRFEDDYFQSDMEDILCLLESGKDLKDICNQLEKEKKPEDSTGQSKADKGGAKEAPKHDAEKQEGEDRAKDNERLTSKQEKKHGEQ